MLLGEWASWGVDVVGPGGVGTVGDVVEEV